VAEFKVNSDINISTDMAPFMTTKGYIFRSGLEAPILLKLKKETRKESMKENKIIKRINDLRFRFRDKLF
jgi:hypothetical protein